MSSAPTSEGAPHRKLIIGVVGAGLLALLIAVVTLVAVGGSGTKETARTPAGSKPASTPTVVSDDELVDRLRASDDTEDAPTLDADEVEDEDSNVAPEQTLVEVGEAGVDEDVTFKVTRLEAVSSIPTDEYSDPVVSRKGAKLVRADITWKNNTNVGLDLFCGGPPATLLDQENRNFDPIDSTIDIIGNGQVCDDDVQPGFKSDVTIAFSMPANAKIQGLILWNSESEDDFDGSISNVAFSN